MITDEQLRQVMPNLRADKRAAYLPFLRSAMEEFGVNTPHRAAAFLAQLAHESGEFRWMEEIWGPSAAQRRYEPQSTLARRLGNTQAGDGKRFKGRGPIQITGRDNYARYGKQLGIDLCAAPERAATPEVAFRLAGLYWQRNGLNELADKGWIKTITKRINGGFNGLPDRLKYYGRARAVLGVPLPRVFGDDDTSDDDAAGKETGDAPRRFARGLDDTGTRTPIAAQRSPRPKTAKKSARAATKITKKAVTKKATKAAAKKKVTDKTAVKTAAAKRAVTKKAAVKQVAAKSTTAKATKASKASGKSLRLSSKSQSVSTRRAR